MIVHKNKLAIVLMSLFAVMSSIKSFAYDIEVANEDGITIYYSWNNDKTELAVSNGEYVFPDTSSGRLVIPAKVSYQGKEYPVTSIERMAYYSCNDIKSVVIPNTVTSIGDYAFCACVELTDVIIPNSVKTIGNCVFYVCQNLTDVTMSDSVTTIGGWAFAQCPKLKAITIPESLTSIGDYVFQGDIGLTSVRIDCKEIGSWFAGFPGLKEVVLGENVESIGNSAFYCSGLESITIPSSVTNIGENAFYGCKNLKNLSIPVSVETLERHAFHYCSNLVKVTIEGCPVIEAETFEDCYRVDTVILKSPTPPNAICRRYEDNHISNGSFDVRIYDSAMLLVPEDAYDAYLTDEAWSQFFNIYTFSDVEYKADFESDSIYYVYLGDGVYVSARYAKKRNNGDGPLTPRDPSVGGQQPRAPSRVMAYSGDIVIPESVSIDDKTYPVTGINDFAFRGCTGLTSITIPAGVEYIGQYAFANCSGLKRIVIEGNPVIDETAFIGCAVKPEFVYTTKVESHKAVEEEGAIHYGIDGRVIQPDAPGLHLIKHKDGNVSKSLVR